MVTTDAGKDAIDVRLLDSSDVVVDGAMGASACVTPPKIFEYWALREVVPVYALA